MRWDIVVGVAAVAGIIGAYLWGRRAAKRKADRIKAAGYAQAKAEIGVVQNVTVTGDDRRSVVIGAADLGAVSDDGSSVVVSADVWRSVLASAGVDRDGRDGIGAAVAGGLPAGGDPDVPSVAGVIGRAALAVVEAEHADAEARADRWGERIASEPFAGSRVSAWSVDDDEDLGDAV